MNTDSTEIALASDADIPALKEIWAVCFGDSAQYIDFFFKKRFPSCTAVCARHNGRAIGAAYLMPVSTMEYGALKKGRYAYAVGLLPPYRGRGIYPMMHRKIMKKLKELNEFFILCPANKKLADYYRSIGFSEFSYLAQRKVICANNSHDFDISDISADKYMNMRNKFFRSDGCIFWDEEAVRYAIEENSCGGGFAAEITCSSGSYAVLAAPRGAMLKIVEATVPDNMIESVSSFLCRKYGFSSAVWNIPAYMSKSGEQCFLSGMTCNLKKGDYPYINLLLN